MQTEQIFCDLREKQEQDLLIWLKTKSLERDGKTQYVKHNFNQRDAAIFNLNNKEVVNARFNGFIDEVKGKSWLGGRKNFGRIFWRCTIETISTRKPHAPSQKSYKTRRQ